MSPPISHLSYKWDALGGDFQPLRCEETWGTQDPSFSHLVIRPVLPEEGPARVPQSCRTVAPSPGELGHLPWVAGASCASSETVPTW